MEKQLSRQQHQGCHFVFFVMNIYGAKFQEHCFNISRDIVYSGFTTIQMQSRENEGTERDIEGVGWDMSIPLNLFLVLGGNGSLFPQTSA